MCSRLHGPAGGGGGLGRDDVRDRPGPAAREVIGRDCRRALDVAAPPARLGQVREPVRVEAVPPEQVLQLGPGEWEGAEPEVQHRDPPVLPDGGVPGRRSPPRPSRPTGARG